MNTETNTTTTETEPITPVIFRKWNKANGGDIIALFPEDVSDYNGKFCGSYEHTGQHGGADYQGVIARTKPATPDEFKRLKDELESEPYNYNFKVYARKTTGHRDAYNAELKRINAA